MRRILPMILMVALLCSCTPGAETPAPSVGTTSGVYTDWSKLTPYEPEQTENIVTRWYEEFTDHLIPCEEYGQLLPYRGARLSRMYETEWSSGDWDLYGLVTTDGKLVVDPVFHSAYQPMWWNSGTGERAVLPLLVLVAVGEWNGEQVNKYALADSQGRWVTEFQYLACAAVGPQGVVVLEESGDCVLLDVSGQEVWRISGGDESWFWDNVWTGGAATLWSTEGLRLLDTQTGQISTLEEGINPQGFSEGLAAASDNSDRYGYIDCAGQWVIDPIYSWGDSFSNGRALVEQDGTECLINRKGEVLRTGQGGLLRCSSSSGDWILDVRREEENQVTVLAAYDMDGTPLAAPAAGTVLHWGVWMYEEKDGETVVWDGPRPITLPLEGYVSDVTADYVLLSNDEGNDCALLSREGEVVIPYGTVGMLYASTDRLTGETYFQTDAGESVLMLDEDGAVLVSSLNLYGGLLRIAEYAGDTDGYLRPDGTWVFRYTMVDGGDI